LGWNQQETKDVEKKIKNKIHFVDNYLLFDIYIIIMTDISISTDETVEIIYNVSEDTSELDFLTIKKEGENIGKENWDKYNVKNIHKFTWTPPKEGNYTLNVNGEEISIEVNEIPDSGVLLDDWANSPTVTSSDITDRKNFTVLEFQEDEPEESDFGPVETRPDWTVHRHTVDVLDGQLRLDEESGEDGGSIRTSQPEVDGVREWQFSFDGFDEMSSSGWNVDLAGEWFGDDETLENGYKVDIRYEGSSSEGIRLLRTDEGGSSTQLIGPSNVGDFTGTDDVVRVLRDSDAEWTLILNGEIVGTETDDTYTSSKETLLSNGTNTDIYVNYYKIW